VVVRQEIASC